jgi:epoxide hydrolase
MHFLHFRSCEERAIPLLAIHGWPSSFMEYAILGRELADGRGALPFHAVVPSRPSFLFAELRDAGVLTPEEFDAKKSELLARM